MKDFCIWGKPEGQARYDQLIAEGWTPLHSGELTVVFVKENICNSEKKVHTDIE